MGQKRGDQEYLKAAGQSPGTRIPDEKRILVYPTETYAAAEPRRSRHCISDAEIAQLVSVALEDAIAALNEPVPEIYIHLRACEARAGIRETLAAFPGGQSKDANTLMEYRRAVMFQNVALELALNMIAAIRRYSTMNKRKTSAKFL